MGRLCRILWQQNENAAKLFDVIFHFRIQWLGFCLLQDRNKFVGEFMMHFASDKARVDVTELSSLDKGVPKVPLLLEHWKQPSVVLTNHTINVFVPFPWRCYVDSSKTHSRVQYPDKGVSGIVLPERAGCEGSKDSGVGSSAKEQTTPSHSQFGGT